MINLIKIFKSSFGLIGFILGVALIAIPTYYFTNRLLVIGNLGYTFRYIEIFLSFVISILFGIYLGSIIYRIKYFSYNKIHTSGIFGGFLGLLISGCPSCSITLLSYLGLASFVSVLPYNGLELKFISIFILIYVNYKTIKDLEVCRFKS